MVIVYDKCHCYALETNLLGFSLKNLIRPVDKRSQIATRILKAELIIVYSLYDINFVAFVDKVVVVVVILILVLVEENVDDVSLF